jgi:hypothetical protein
VIDRLIEVPKAAGKPAAFSFSGLLFLGGSPSPKACFFSVFGVMKVAQSRHGTDNGRNQSGE